MRQGEGRADALAFLDTVKLTGKLTRVALRLTIVEMNECMIHL